MQAAVFHGPRDVRLTAMAEPTPQPGEVLIKVQRAGICGSDVNRFRYGSHPWPPGFIMGHEFCGEIAALGSEVIGWQVGQQVVVEPTLYCGTCFYCQQGYHNRCVDFMRRGITGSGTNGAFAEYVCVPAYQPHARPPALSIDVASLVEPMAVSVHGWRLAGIEQPDSVVVVGIGNIGLLALLVAKARRVRHIIAIGKYAPRQALAYAYGAALVLEPDDPQLQTRVLECTNGLGAELVLEAAGTPSSLRTAVAVARKGGKIVVLGVFHEEVALDFRMLLLTEKHLIGSFVSPLVLRQCLHFGQYLVKAHPLEMVLPPAWVIERLTAYQGQKTPGLHWSELLFQYCKALGTQHIICKQVRHEEPPVYSP